MSERDQFWNWRNIIWREWRYTEDKEFAQHLFDLVADEPVGWRVTTILVLLSAAYGTLAGLLIGLLLGLITVSTNASILILAITLLACPLIGGVLGGTAGFLVRKLFGQHLSWRRWLGWLAPKLTLSEVGKLLDPSKDPFGGSLSFILLFWICAILFLGPVVNLTILSIPKLIHWLVNLLTRKQTGQTIASNTQLDYAYVHEYRKWYFWWQKRPSMSELEAALQKAQSLAVAKEVWTVLLRQLEQKKKQSVTPEALITALQSNHWDERFVARYTLVSLGGEAVEGLIAVAEDKTFSRELQETAIWLLRNIGWETTTRLADQASGLLCPRCLMPCSLHRLQVSSWESFTYYGCFTCHQSRDFMTVLGEVVAVLDADMTDPWEKQDDSIRINWLTRRTLFDFDRVEIIQATDEDVERFAVQVGNDTDTFRQPRYKQMRCIVAPDCQLSENTWRILQRFFGEVEREGTSSKPGVIIQKEFDLQEKPGRRSNLPLMDDASDQESIAKQ